ncbi:hypothetical protein BN946_scf184985.g69 [Trametes cinnabarina]|uniref:Uncharacterized protein n=1 Tax=Pycnoporus cinnabarinus TaxID=5643 RepID=A0A060SE54_PYCCI|nr:hypothetical protein BN946_scf184985.g69 [Trametes cinnabarina]
MLRLSDLEQPIQPLYNAKGEISPEFPKRLVDLFNMTNETAVTLLRDYAPNDKPTDSRDSNVNAVMRICGVRFVLVRRRSSS